MHLSIFAKKDTGRIKTETKAALLQRMGGSRVEEMKVAGKDTPTFFLYSFDFGNNVHVFCIHS